ncbi:recombination protein RecA [Alysiella filiformis DSM 16848]|uniref:Protein RecA n=2 Tax=Alysiella TaxID=194195 RepID=A0A286EAW8_9NEIS|nr:recombination protein RecA [Alysiella filiformis DSM 16848]
MLADFFVKWTFRQPCRARHKTFRLPVTCPLPRWRGKVRVGVARWISNPSPSPFHRGREQVSGNFKDFCRVPKSSLKTIFPQFQHMENNIMATKQEKDAVSAKTDASEKSKALAAALAQIEKNFGKGAVMKMDGSHQEENLQVISTGSLTLDLALGVGGLPRGRIVEIFGPESSGKTTLCLEAIAQCQKNGGICAFIDAENAFDPVYARKLGVQVEDLYVSQPDTGEQALEICDTLVRSGGVDMVVIDSVAALVPKAEIEGEMGDSHVGLQARLMSQALRKLTGSIKKTNTLVVFINQVRMKIGVMFGNPETTTGGNALKFYASVRLDIRGSTQIKAKEGDDPIGKETKVKVIKNKVAPPFRTAEFDILYGEGISYEGELIDLGVKADVIQKSGAWFSYNGAKIGQGKDNVRNWLKENAEIAAEIDQKIRNHAGLDSLIEMGSPEDEDGDTHGEFAEE